MGSRDQYEGIDLNPSLTVFLVMYCSLRDDNMGPNCAVSRISPDQRTVATFGAPIIVPATSTQSAIYFCAHHPSH